MDAHGYVEHCKNILRQNGYVVIREERRVVITARTIVPPHEVEYSRLNAERYADMVRSSHLQRLIVEANDKGLVLYGHHDIDDPVTGHEVVFASSIGLIKPKPDVGNAS